MLTPTGRDAEITTRILRSSGMLAHAAESVDELCRGIERGAAAVIVAEEALGPAGAPQLRGVLARQPAWSDLPVIVFTQRAGGGRGPLEGSGRDATLLDRPVRIDTLLSVARAALRARRRQYEIRDLLARLQEQDQRKDQFLAVLGHELRNPLAAIQTAIVLVNRVDDPRTARAREVIVRQTRNLGRIVDDLLDVSRVTRGKITLQRQRVDLRVAVERAFVTVDPDTHGSLASVSLTLPDSAVWVNGDPVRLEQIVMNLVQNALKYTPDGGAVAVAVERDGDEAVLRVRDSGLGIPPEMLPRIFEPFVQVQDTAHRKAGGLGLGLPVVKALAELHGGRVNAYSDGPGCGAELVVRMPCEPAPPEAASATASPTPSRADASGATVLVADDDDDIRDLLGELLRRWGYRVFTAANGQEAVETILRDSPGVALIDIGMPVMDGYAAAKRISASSTPRATRLVAMTGFGQPEDRRRAYDAGFERHLIKPVDADELARVLAELSPPR